MSSKAAEGMELVQQAEKHLKTSFMKWKPDYELAADCYTKAATCFKNAKDLKQCKDCLYKAADCYKQTKSYFSAAKSLDQSVLILKEMQDWKEISLVAHRACQLFQEHGSPDTAALMLDKAGKIIEPHIPEDALTLYKRAMEVVMIEDRPRQAAEYASKAARLLIKLGRYNGVCDVLEREMSYHQAGENLAALGRILVALVLVHLVQDDVVAAAKAIQDWGGSCRQDELEVALRLQGAFDSEDPDLAKKALADPFIRHMDVEYAKLTRIVPLPKGLEKTASADAPVISEKSELSKTCGVNDDDDDIEKEYGLGEGNHDKGKNEEKIDGEDDSDEGLC